MESSKVLAAIVDDELPVRKAVGRLLRSAGLEVQCFGSGAEFIDALAGGRPDCVILDVHMPGMTGFDVQARLHASGIRLPVIFITAFDDPDAAQRLEQAGAAGFLRKPFTDEELLQAIRLAVGAGDSKTERR
ncbi:response regulator transcription factor [Methylococcus sp. EFPC2]|uniref:response regulator transcription factor n=1 Tax=Methylococcus sp. EFPC2 TaxID=2812648 RepID=UPI00196831CF|nr:response regulator [Methylococcus sp. EFPC2]QSA97850.1 response regulator [Methylococcus sp. EFPC2]